MSYVRSFARCLVVMACCYASASHADCVDTIGLNAAEMDFYKRAHAALKALLPLPPVAEGLWSRDGEMLDNIWVCRTDKKIGNFVVTATRKYVWPDPQKRSADAAVTATYSINVPDFKDGPGDHDFSGAYGNPSPQRSAGLKVVNVTWVVSASGYGIKSQSDALRNSISGAIDRTRLQSLIGRTLPTLAESNAKANKLQPTQLVIPAPSEPAATAKDGGAAAPLSSSSAAPNTLPTPAGALPAPPRQDNQVQDALDTVNKLRGLFGR